MARNRRRGVPYKGIPAKKRRSRAGPLIVVIILLLSVAVGYFMIQDYLVFTADGVKFNFTRPPVAVDDTPNPTDELPAPTVTPEISVDMSELPPMGAGHLSARYIDIAEMTNSQLAAAVAQLRDRGIKAVVVDIKSPDGRLTYKSALTPAVRAGVNAANTRFTELVELCAQADIRVIGKISCFRDDSAARAVTDMAVQVKNGDAFLDGDGSSWLDPYNAAAREYIAGIVRETRALGVREFIFDSVSFPSNGSLKSAVYAESELPKSGILAQFLSEMREAADGGRIGAVIDRETAGEGGSEVKGQDLARFTETCDRIWVHADDRAMAKALHGQIAGLSRESGYLVSAIIGDEYLSASMF